MLNFNFLGGFGIHPHIYPPQKRHPPQKQVDYWVDHVSNAVRFTAGMEALENARSPEVFLEIGQGQGSATKNCGLHRLVPRNRNITKDWVYALDLA